MVCLANPSFLPPTPPVAADGFGLAGRDYSRGRFPAGPRGPALAGNWGDGWLFRADAGSVSGSADESLPPKAPTTRVNEMAKGKKKLEVIHLVCEETGDQNYTLRRKTGGEKLKVKKYSPRLRKHTLHLEKKK